MSFERTYQEESCKQEGEADSRIPELIPCDSLVGIFQLQEAAETTRDKLAVGNGAALFFSAAAQLRVRRFFANRDGYKINFLSPTDLPEEILVS